MTALRFCLPMVLLSIAACATRGDPTQPIPTAFVPAPQAAQRLVVVLPGRGDDLEDLQESGIVKAIQDNWPDADVILAEVTLSFYEADKAIPRLHEEIIEPARKHDYERIWLAGASLGGMGSILYDRAHPGYVDGLLLLAPYLGDEAIIAEIAAAGGLAHWIPGPPEELGPDTWQREVWRHVKTLATDPLRRCRMWLAYGADDDLREPIGMITPLLPATHVLMLPGGHDWRVWTPAMQQLLRPVAVDADHPDSCNAASS